MIDGRWSRWCELCGRRMRIVSESCHIKYNSQTGHKVITTLYRVECPEYRRVKVKFLWFFEYEEPNDHDWELVETEKIEPNDKGD